MKEAPEGDKRIFIEKDSEIDAIVDFLRKTWEGTENLQYNNPEDAKNGDPLRHFVDFVLSRGESDASGWIDDFEVVYETINNLREQRGQFVKGFDPVDNYDYLSKFLSHLGFKVKSTCEVTKGYPYWDFSKMSNFALIDAGKIFSGIGDMSPKNFSKKEEGYEDFDGMEYSTKEWANNFDGYDLAAGTRSFSLPDRLHWSQVMYSKNGQGISVKKTLVSSIYAHGLGLSENNNTMRLKQKIEDFAAPLMETPFSPEQIDLSELKEDFLLKIVFDAHEYEKKLSGEEFFDFLKPYSFSEINEMKKDMLEHKRVFDSLTEEEKKERLKKKQGEILQRVLEKEDDPQEKEREALIEKFIISQFGFSVDDGGKLKRRKSSKSKI